MLIQTLVKRTKNFNRVPRRSGNSEQELMKLYREHNANPLGAWCLPYVQMPILLALSEVLNSFKPSHERGGNAGSSAIRNLLGLWWRERSEAKDLRLHRIASLPIQRDQTLRALAAPHRSGARLCDDSR